MDNSLTIQDINNMEKNDSDRYTSSKPQRKQSTFRQKEDHLLAINKNLQKEFNSHKSDFYQALYNTLKLILGLGVIAMPYALFKSGWMLGIIVIILIGLLSMHCVNNILIIQEHLEYESGEFNMNLQNITERLFGCNISYSVEFFIIAYQIGTTLAYLSFFHQFFQEIFNYFNLEFPVFLQIIFILIIICPQTLANNLHQVYKSSMLGVICCFITCLVILTTCIVEIQENGKLKEVHDTFKMEGFHYVLSISLFSFQGLGSIFNIKKSLKNPQDMVKIHQLSTYITIPVYIFIGSVSVYAYGHHTKFLAFENLPYDKIEVIITKIMYSISLIMTYPLVTLPTFQILEKHIMEFINKRVSHECDEENLLQYAQYCIRLPFLVVVYIVSVYTFNISQMLQIVGGIFGMIVQIIIPQILFLKFFKNKIHCVRYSIEIIIFIISLAICLFTCFNVL